MSDTNDRNAVGGSALQTGDFGATGRYSRAEAIADRALVAVPETFSKECHFRVPVALSSAAWEECIEWAEAGTQDVLWDVLFMAVDAIRRKDRKTDRADFVVHRVATGQTESTPVALKVVVGPGDAREPVLTIYLSSEE